MLHYNQFIQGSVNVNMKQRSFLFTGHISWELNAKNGHIILHMFFSLLFKQEYDENDKIEDWRVEFQISDFQMCWILYH